MQKKLEMIMKFCREMISALINVEPEICLRLFAQGALAANQVSHETITYEFISEVRMGCSTM